MKEFDKEKWNTATRNFIQFVDNVPSGVLSFRPEIEDAWTAHEHIIHVVDSEINAFIRLKTILGQSGADTFIVNEEQWAKNIDYSKELIDDYLELFQLIRELESNIFLNVINSDQMKNFVVHENYGKVDIETWLDWYTEKHINEHIIFIERNIKIYESLSKIV
ncbi:MAG: hypothetical protein PQJ46_09965 [Spirochaetales bacterium]|nr:hypothetical protein [Spirochaetales bacterium]